MEKPADQVHEAEDNGSLVKHEKCIQLSRRRANRTTQILRKKHGFICDANVGPIHMHDGIRGRDEDRDSSVKGGPPVGRGCWPFTK